MTSNEALPSDLRPDDPLGRPPRPLRRHRRAEDGESPLLWRLALAAALAVVALAAAGSLLA